MLALGLIEIVGLAAAIEAADAAVKSANVKLIGYELTKGDGMVTIKVEGDVGAVKAAMDAAKAAASKIGQVYSVLVIPRPAENLEKIIFSKDTVGLKKEEPPVVVETPVELDEPEEVVLEDGTEEVADSETEPESEEVTEEASEEATYPIHKRKRRTK